MSRTASSSYEHWPDDATLTSSTTMASISGYTKHNGMRECEYEPANTDKASTTTGTTTTAKLKSKGEKMKAAEIEAAPEAPLLAPAPPAHIAQPYQYSYPPRYSYCAPSPQYPYFPNPSFIVPAPAYYGLPVLQLQHPYDLPPGYCYVPAYAPAVESRADTKGEGNGGKKKSKKLETMKWQGRTKAEVEEDNMKIAVKEGAYKKRKIEPVGLGDDQPVWVVLGNGSHALRMYSEAKEMKGEWHKDPRFKGSLYLVCEQDKVEGNGKEKAEGKDYQAESKGGKGGKKGGNGDEKKSGKKDNERKDEKGSEEKDENKKDGADAGKGKKGGKKGKKGGNGGKKQGGKEEQTPDESEGENAEGEEGGEGSAKDARPKEKKCTCGK
ncbi:uncharacterized protein LTR77_007979 [Saxophila tyrrhenica]|uniref:Uncharacterized protein n=1 Tax=Saxophila tyrrhenica TaxID=1690608 RepID=A0AAV9P4B0_9PEZI|nr:hypothetical protein LTR77_007979 [Saxophila tyrrhenica]